MLKFGILVEFEVQLKKKIEKPKHSLLRGINNNLEKEVKSQQKHLCKKAQVQLIETVCQKKTSEI